MKKFTVVSMTLVAVLVLLTAGSAKAQQVWFTTPPTPPNETSPGSPFAMGGGWQNIESLELRRTLVSTGQQVGDSYWPTRYSNSWAQYNITYGQPSGTQMYFYIIGYYHLPYYPYTSMNVWQRMLYTVP
jgi:hypothetical protein